MPSNKQKEEETERLREKAIERRRAVKSNVSKTDWGCRVIGFHFT